MRWSEDSVSSPDVTTLLEAWSAGDAGARENLVPLVYAELRRRAAKRSGQWRQVTLDEGVAGPGPRGVDVLDLDAALERLAVLDLHMGRIAQLRFFAGASLQDTARVLGVSVATVEWDRQVARAFLYHTMQAQPR